jgi:protein SCO1
MKRVWKIGLGITVLSMSAAALVLAARPEAAHQAHDHRAVALVNHQGSAVDIRDYQGKFLLVYFGYSQCRRDCPQALGLLSHTLEMLGGDREVRALFISLDERDTPQRLEGFMRAFHPGIEALAFRDREAMRCMSDTFELFTAETVINGQEAQLTDHEPALFLLDRSGAILDRFPMPTAPQEIIGAIHDHRQDGGISI